MKRLVLVLLIACFGLTQVNTAGADDFTTTQKTRTVLPKFYTTVELSAGEKITKDDDVVAWANKTCPVGKKATVRVSIRVISLEDEQEEA